MGVSQADSGFFCEGYSSDDDVLVKEEFRGNIAKQGCLLKQVMGKLEPIPAYGEHFSRWPRPSWPCGSYGDLVTHRLGRLQGHRIKNWKVRKFILRDDPAFMHYYDPSKVTPADSGESRNVRPSVFTALLPFSSE